MVRHGPRQTGFTLIELLTVVSIISLLISILLPSLSQAREQSKGVYCLARLRDMAIALNSYENGYTTLPTAEFPICPEPSPLNHHGWAELLAEQIYEKPPACIDFPAQRNVREVDGWYQNYFNCKSAKGPTIGHSGHYRVYLPAWSYGTFTLREDGTYDLSHDADPLHPARLEHIPLKLPLLGDVTPDAAVLTGYVGAGQAFIGGEGANRFDDRHYGGVNFLFPDGHVERSTRLHKELQQDYDLNRVLDETVVP
jgi:prepilin-type N-terminal cleavage/methylation domain-containing protein/prepilin-type processing-associated H-X9-DG protein